MSGAKKSYELSITELKKYPGFENVSDEEAQETIFQLKELSFILFDAFQKEQAKKEKMTADVTLESVYNELSQLKSYLVKLNPSTGKRIFNNKTLSEYIGVSTRTLQHWRDEGRISFTQIRDVILYDEEDVQDFMKKHKRISFQ